ncbi:MAG: MFS transporter [Tepidiformaceae bacterium]
MTGVSSTAESAATAPPRGFGYVVGSEGISVAGDWVLLTAAAVTVFKETGSTTAVSLMLGAAAVPTVLLGPIAGAVADCFDRRRIMLFADLLSASVLLLCLAGVSAGLKLPAVYLAVAAVAILSTFDRPASEALLPRLVPLGGLGRANSSVRFATRLAQIAGPAAASGLLSTGGLSLVLGVDAASFFLSALLVLGIDRRVSRPGREGGSHSPLRAAAAGIAYVRARGRLFTVMLAIGVVSLMGPIVNAGTITLVSDELHLPDSRYGVLLAVEGGGALLLALAFLWLGKRLPLLPAGAAALLVTGSSAVLLGVAPNLWAACLAMALQGAGVVGLQVGFASYLQSETEDAYRGRVMSLVSVVASFAALLGFAGAGPLVELSGVRAAFVVVGLVIIAAAIPVVLLAWRVARGSPATIRTG